MDPFEASVLRELLEASKPFERESKSTEFPTSCGIHYTAAQELRLRADAIERRDAEIDRLRKAVRSAEVALRDDPQ